MDPLGELVAEAFAAVVEAEGLIYAAGMGGDTKNDIIEAHSALLRLRNRLEAQQRRRACATRKEALNGRL